MNVLWTSRPPTQDELAEQSLRKTSELKATAASERKLIGVEFDGVMCSATSADQSGLTAVFILIQMQGASFQPTAFEFENGSVLVIHLGNWQAFAEVWTAFRQSFFKLESK